MPAGRCCKFRGDKSRDVYVRSRTLQQCSSVDTTRCNAKKKNFRLASDDVLKLLFSTTERVRTPSEYRLSDWKDLGEILTSHLFIFWLCVPQGTKHTQLTGRYNSVPVPEIWPYLHVAVMMLCMKS